MTSGLFNVYAEYIMQNARLDESEVVFKFARRNVNNFKYTDDTTIIARNRRGT